MSLLNSLTKVVEKPSKRLGRGPGSGKGRHTVGRGTKGQRARKSGEAPLWFEGGQLPLTKRLPMLRGKSRFNVLIPTAAVRLSDLEKMSSDVISLDTLKLEGLIDGRFKKAKVIANGSLTRKVIVRGIAVSKAAATIIEQAGGSIEK
jgi:large subunit ribosomal protein L15